MSLGWMHTGGFNLYPREVEDVVATHPAVVVLRDGAAYDDRLVAEVVDLVKERKGSVQAPQQVIAVEAIPLTGLGKPDKKALRARFRDGGDRGAG